jgi:hypothetical protein
VAARHEARAPRLADLLVEPSWREVLGPEFGKPYMPQLQAFLEKEWAAATVYPAQEAIFRWGRLPGGSGCCTQGPRATPRRGRPGARAGWTPQPCPPNTPLPACRPRPPPPQGLQQRAV